MRIIPLARPDGATAEVPGSPGGSRIPEPMAMALPTPPDDAALLSEIRAGSATALQQLMDRFWPELVRYAARDLADVELARDIAQETFIQVWERRRSLTPLAYVRAYLYRIVRSKVIDEKRRRRVRLDWARREQHGALRAPPTPAEVMAGEEILAAYRRAVASLPGRRREVFDLVFVSGLAHDEAAHVLGIQRQTVANQMSAALRQVRTALSRELGGSP